MINCSDYPKNKHLQNLCQHEKCVSPIEVFTDFRHTFSRAKSAKVRETNGSRNVVLEGVHLAERLTLGRSVLLNWSFGRRVALISQTVSSGQLTLVESLFGRVHDLPPSETVFRRSFIVRMEHAVVIVGVNRPPGVGPLAASHTGGPTSAEDLLPRTSALRLKSRQRWRSAHSQPTPPPCVRLLRRMPNFHPPVGLCSSGSRENVLVRVAPPRLCRFPLFLQSRGDHRRASCKSVENRYLG